MQGEEPLRPAMFVRFTRASSPQSQDRPQRSLLVLLERIAAVSEDDNGRTWLHLDGFAVPESPASGEPSDVASLDLRRVMLAESFEEVAHRIDEALRGRALLTSKRRADEWPISVLGLTARSANCLTRLGVRTIEELRRVDDKTLLEMRNFGQTSLREVREKLERLDEPP